jgi:hypothetical protein
LGVTGAASGLRDDALDRVARAAGAQLEELSLSEYRVLRDRSEEDLPPLPAIWAMFGSYQRMREFALLRRSSAGDPSSLGQGDTCPREIQKER